MVYNLYMVKYIPYTWYIIYPIYIILHTLYMVYYIPYIWYITYPIHGICPIYGLYIRLYLNLTFLLLFKKKVLKKTNVFFRHFATLNARGTR